MSDDYESNDSEEYRVDPIKIQAAQETLNKIRANKVLKDKTLEKIRGAEVMSIELARQTKSFARRNKDPQKRQALAQQLQSAFGAELADTQTIIESAFHEADNEKKKNVTVDVLGALVRSGELGSYRWNEMSLTLEYASEPPFPRYNRESSTVHEHDYRHAREWLAREKKALVRDDELAGALRCYAEPYHPVRDYLDGLQWDGKPRLSSWLFDFVGVRTDIPGSDRKALEKLYQKIGRAFLISAVARIYQPGCKVDTMLVFEGVQGARKSTAFRVLCGSEWFGDDTIDITNKDSWMVIRRFWIFEHAELDSIARKDVGSVKAFISRQTDTFRLPYGRETQSFKRQNVFVGSVNDSQYLKDSTGNRRYWVVPVGVIDVDGLAAARDQLWAEAVAAYRANELWWLEEKDDQAALQSVQAARTVENPLRERLETWIADREFDKHHTQYAGKRVDEKGYVYWTSAEIQKAAYGDDSLPTTIQAMQLGSAMASLGYERSANPVAVAQSGNQSGKSRIWIKKASTKETE